MNRAELLKDEVAIADMLAPFGLEQDDCLEGCGEDQFRSNLSHILESLANMPLGTFRIYWTQGMKFLDFA
jgi:hypothetical protein